MAEKFHCEECAGTAKAKGEECSTCDGTGKQKSVKKTSSKGK